MDFFSTEEAQTLGNDLKNLGFENFEQILHSAVERPNPAVPPLQHYRGFRLTDPASNEFQVKFEFHLAQYAPDNPPVLFFIRAAMPYHKIDGEYNGKEVSIGYHRSEPFPTKDQIVKDLLAIQKLEQQKEALRKNADLKNDLARLGFTNYEKMVSGASQWVGGFTLQESVEVDERIGSGQDNVNFLISIGNASDQNKYGIKLISATLELPPEIAQNEAMDMSLYYFPSKGKFPTVDKMVSNLIQELRNKFLRYAKAYSLMKDLKVKTKGFKKQGRNNHGLGPPKS
jgi:hypothetical protein